MHTDLGVAVVGDRLVTAINRKTNDVEVRFVHAPGQVVHTMHLRDNSIIVCMSSVADHPELIVTGGVDGDVHLWNIDKGACASLNE
jgi:WD40 repeat protein